MADDKRVIIPRKPTDVQPARAARLNDLVIGNQAPANHIVPMHVSTMGDDAVEFLRLCGVHLDEWQELVLRESLNVDHRGRWAATEACLLVPRQQGKALWSDTEMLTTVGWKTIATVEVGDEVFHPDGTPVRVTYKSPTMIGHPCYRVKTTDGREVIADADHLWTVEDRSNAKWKGPRGGQGVTYATRTMTTKEFLGDGLLNTRGHRFRLPTQRPLELPTQKLPIHPYVLGAWLGDGSSTDATFTGHPSDLPYWGRAFRLRGIETSAHGDPYRIGLLSGTFRALSELGLRGRKHVPDIYLLADRGQRLELLRGLMDTDGSCVRGRVRFSSSDRRLAEAVLFLARSLGEKPRLATARARSGYRREYEVAWQALGDNPFGMPRKAELVTGRFNRPSLIASIEEVDSLPVQCIKVDREDGLFLAGRDLLPTHNTVVAEARELVGLFMLGEKLLVHQAQMFATAKESFLRQCARVKACPDLDAMVSKYRSGNDNVGIELVSGGRLLYQARGPDSLRGFSIDFLLLDEAYALTPEVMAAALHATSAMVNPMVMYCSSTGREDSQVLHDLRDRALRRDPRVAMWEWKADDDCDPKDPVQWAQANPALGIRLSKDFIETEGNNGKWGKEFKRERLGLWADPATADVISTGDWELCKDIDAIIVGEDLIAAVDVAPYRDSATVAMCGIAADGRRQVEIIQTGPGTDWVVDYVKKLLMSSQPPVKVTIQGGGAPGALIAPLLQAGADLIVLGSADIGRGTGEFVEAITNKTVAHLGDPLIERAIGNATRYNIGSKEGAQESPAWGFARKDMNGADITPIVACCYAYYGMSKFYAEEAQKPIPAHIGAPIGGRIW